MIATDAVAVAIAADADDLEFVVAQLDAGADSQRAAMERVHAVGIDEAGQVRGATDAANDHDLVRLEAQLKQGGLQCGKQGKIAAARAPSGMDFALVTLFSQLGSGCEGFCEWPGFDECAHKSGGWWLVTAPALERELATKAGC